jgi:hypothetical protein
VEGQGREWALYPNAAKQKGKKEGERRAGWEWVGSASVACSRADLEASNPREALACRSVLTAPLDRQGCGFPNSIQCQDQVLALGLSRNFWLHLAELSYTISPIYKQVMAQTDHAHEVHACEMHVYEIHA